MQSFDPGPLILTLDLVHPLIVRTIAFDVPTFDILKDYQRRLEAILKRHIGNAETLKYLLHTHPDTARPEGSAVGGR